MQNWNTVGPVDCVDFSFSSFGQPINQPTFRLSRRREEIKEKLVGLCFRIINKELLNNGEVREPNSDTSNRRIKLAQSQM